MVMGIANLAMATGNIGREGVGVNPLRGQNNVQGSCDMGSFPHELAGYRHVSDAATRALFGAEWGVQIEPEPGLRIPNMFEAALDGSFKALYCQGEDIAQSDPNTQHVTAALVGAGMPGRAGPVPERNGEVRARVLPGLVVPREGRHVHECRAAHLARAQGDAAAGRPRRLGGDDRLRARARLRDELLAPVRDHGRDRAPDADVHGRLVREARRARQHPVALQRRGAGRHADDARRRVRARQGPVLRHRVRADQRARQRAASR